MIKSVEVSHTYGQYNRLKMILDSPESSEGYAVTEIRGLTPGKTNIGTTDWAIIDGSSVISNRLGKRTISIDIRFLDDYSGRTIEQMREYLYLYFPIKKNVKLTFTKTNGKSYYINGIIEKNEPIIWSKEESATIDVLCPNPYFKDSEFEEFDYMEQIPYWHFDSFEPRVYVPDESLDFYPDSDIVTFPISEILTVKERILHNSSNVDVGLEMTIKALGPVYNPGIMNETSRDVFHLLYKMTQGEEITIISRDAEHSVVSNKVGSVLQYVDLAANDWIKLYPGDNRVSIFSDSGLENMNLKVKSRPIYVGL